MTKQEKTSIKLLPVIAIALIKKGCLLDMGQRTIIIKNYEDLGLKYNTISIHTQTKGLIAWDCYEDKVHCNIYTNEEIKLL